MCVYLYLGTDVTDLGTLRCQELLAWIGLQAPLCAFHQTHGDRLLPDRHDYTPADTWPKSDNNVGSISSRKSFDLSNLTDFVIVLLEKHYEH